MVVGGIVTAFIPIIIALISIFLVRKTQKRKEEAEAKLAETQAQITETQLVKIQKESRDVILKTINEPTIKDITEGYNNLMANFKIQIEQLQNENKRLRYDFDAELKCLKSEIDELRKENKTLREELDKEQKDNATLKKKINSFIKKTDKKINQETK